MQTAPPETGRYTSRAQLLLCDHLPCQYETAMQKVATLTLCIQAVFILGVAYLPAFIFAGSREGCQPAKGN